MMIPLHQLSKAHLLNIDTKCIRLIKQRQQIYSIIPSAFVRCLTQEQKDKQFVDGPTPYQKPKRLCILCKNKIELDYKNPRLLSQFVSPLNGDIYDKHITGLCEMQQKILEREIKKSRSSLFMPIFFKQPRYNKDPKLVNPDRPQRPNPY